MHVNCLIVDDEESLADSTVEYFEMFDVTAHAVYGAQECLGFFKQHTADLLLLDINLGDASGFDLCRMLRKTTEIPILFISARQSDDDILLALNIGGDDYIRKPYSLSVLLAKVNVMLRRFTHHKDSLQLTHLKFDFGARMVWKDDVPISLKGMEYRLLQFLVLHQGQIVTKEELFRNVWEDAITSDGTLNVHIRHLRKKIEDDPNQPKYIRTIWGRGYLFEDAVV